MHSWAYLLDGERMGSGSIRGWDSRGGILESVQIATIRGRICLPNFEAMMKVGAASKMRWRQMRDDVASVDDAIGIFQLQME